MNIKKISHKIAVIVTKENNPDEALLLFERTEKQAQPKWNIIKGTWKPTEETMREAIDRECQEEASISIKLKNFLGCYTLHKDNGDITIQFNFLASTNNYSPKPADPTAQERFNENIEKIQWFKKDEILKMDKSEFLTGRTHMLLDSWINNELCSLDTLKELK